MPTEIVINATLPEIRIALIEDGEILDLSTEYEKNKGVVGNIYKGRVTRVLPGMQAAFVDIGLERAAFLYVGDVVVEDDTIANAEKLSESKEKDEEGNDDIEVDAGAYLEDKNLEELETKSAGFENVKDSDQIEDEDSDGDEDNDNDNDEDNNDEDNDEDSDNIESSEGESEGEDSGVNEASEVEDASAAAATSRNMGSGTEATKSVGRRAERDNRANKFKRKKQRGKHPHKRLKNHWKTEKPPQINEILREGQEIVVQVTKEQMGTKGARLTCHLALPGRHVVLIPTVDHVGVSRKIATAAERRRLRDIINELRPPGMGFIVRTMAEGASNEQITNEVNYLLGLYSETRRKRERMKSPSLLHEDLSVILRTVRDNFTSDIYRLVVDSPRVFEYVHEYIGKVAPPLKNRVVEYKGKDPIFDAYGINSEVSRALNRKVWLKSGGYLIVDQAEALTVIDVNTGKFIGKKSFEDTILKTNLEAVAEVAYQLRLRDAGGIIIIDLIDMERANHREQVYRALENALRKDKAKTNILRISELGLIQMTRKRTKESLNHIFCQPCPYCNGNGSIKNIRTITFDIFRELERTALEGGITGANVMTHPEVMDHMYREERDTLDRLEERFGMKISVRADASLHLEAYNVIGERLSFQR